eukprot:COSAG02_NODE_32767_length_511_cov_0.694175_1_plen_150_part_01
MGDRGEVLCVWERGDSEQRRELLRRYPETMMLAARIARPAARAAPVRNLTQVSSEARRYSFAHAADDIIGEDWGLGEEGTGMSAGPRRGRVLGALLLARPPAPPPPRPAHAPCSCHLLPLALRVLLGTARRAREVLVLRVLLAVLPTSAT